MDGLLLFAHGARDPAWARPFEEVAQSISAQRPGIPVGLAYLEFMTPSIEEAAHALVSQGCTRIHIVPMFLGAGGHVRKDIPPLLSRLREAHGALEWLLHPALGDQAAVKQAMADASLALMENKSQ